MSGQVEHEAVIEDDEGDKWAVCQATGRRGLGMAFGEIFGMTTEERALRTLNRACTGATHKAKEAK